MTVPANPTSTYTVEELIISRLAKAYKGEIVGFGATICSNIATRLAKAIYNPDLIIFGGTAVSFDCSPGPKVLNDDFVGNSSSVMRVDWTEMLNFVSRDKFRICIGPVQIDRTGASNISVIGDWKLPKVQLIGSRGIPDDMVGIKELYFHVVRHTPRSVVNRVDFVCGAGLGELTTVGLTTGRSALLVTNLGVFVFDQKLGQMEIESLHPGVDFDMVQAATGFPLVRPPIIATTMSPTKNELFWIRERLDPMGLRELESRNPPSNLLDVAALRERSFWGAKNAAFPALTLQVP